MTTDTDPDPKYRVHLEETMWFKTKLERDAPPTNTAPGTYTEKQSSANDTNDLEATGSGRAAELASFKLEQRRVSPEAEQIVVRKLDRRVR